MPITVVNAPQAVEPASGPIQLDLLTDRVWAGGAAGAARQGILELGFASTPANATTTTLMGQVFTYLTTLGEDGQGEVLRGTTFSLPSAPDEANAVAFAERLADAIRRHTALEADYQVRVLGITAGQGSNLLTAGDNGTFEANATGWTGGTRVNTQSFGGLWSYERVGTSILTAASAVSVTNGTSYRVIAWVKMAAADDLTFRLGTAIADVTPQVVAGEWVRIQATIVANTTGSVNVEIQPGGPTLAWIDDVSVAQVIANGQVTIRIEGTGTGLPFSHAGQGRAVITQPSAGSPREAYEAVVRVDVESATVPGGYEPQAELAVAVRPIPPADPNDPDSANLAPYEFNATAFVDGVVKGFVDRQYVPIKEQYPKVLERAAVGVRLLYGDRWVQGGQSVRGRLTAGTPFVVLNCDFDDTTNLYRRESRTNTFTGTICTVLAGQGLTLQDYCYPTGLPKWLTPSPERGHIRGAPLWASIYTPALADALDRTSVTWEGIRESDGATISGLIPINPGLGTLRYPAPCDEGIPVEQRRVVLFQFDTFLASQINQCSSLTIRLTDDAGTTPYTEDLVVSIQPGCGEYVLVKYLNDFGVPEILICPAPYEVSQRTSRQQFRKPSKRLGVDEDSRRSLGIADVQTAWAYTVGSSGVGRHEALRWAEMARSRDVEVIVDWAESVPRAIPAIVEDEELAYTNTVEQVQTVVATLVVEAQFGDADAPGIGQAIGSGVGGGGLSTAQVQALIDAAIDPVEASVTALESDLVARVDQWGMPIATNIASLDGVNDYFTWATAGAALPDEFTFTCWVKPTLLSSFRALFSTNGSGSGTDTIVIAITSQSSTVGLRYLRMTAAGAVVLDYTTPSGDIDLMPYGVGNWVHIAARMRRIATTSADIWVNAQRFGVASGFALPPTNYGSVAAIGALNGSGPFVRGSMSNATLHPRLLTRAEILSLARRGRAFALPTGATAHWPFDGVLTDDATGNGNTLTALGGVTSDIMH